MTPAIGLGIDWPIDFGTGEMIPKLVEFGLRLRIVIVTVPFTMADATSFRGDFAIGFRVR